MRVPAGPANSPRALPSAEGDLRSPLVVELLKERFDAEWRDGRHPSLEEFLNGVVEADRPALLRDLLRIELDWRQRRLETHIPSEYFQRFHNYHDIVQETFRAMGGLTTDAGCRAASTDFDLRRALAAHPAREAAERDAAPFGVPPNPGSQPAPGASPSTRSTPSTSAPLRRVGNYEILGELARGGMGVVYRARQLGLGRIVALKMVIDRSIDDEENRRRFRREAESAGRLSHPGLVPIYDFGEHEGQLYYSMEHVEGQSLEQIAQKGPLPPLEAARILAEVADAVHYAHSNDVIHRDLKPSNILLDSLGRPRVADFGLARHLSCDSQGTAPGQVLGTPSYMPPEQAAGNLALVGPHSDVYSLGASLYHILTGRPPFLTSNRFDTMQQVLQKPPVPPRTFDPTIPEELERICLRCLEKSPLRRPATARELADALRAFLRKAAPAMFPSQLARRAERTSRVIQVALCVGAVISLGVALLAVWAGAN